MIETRNIRFSYSPDSRFAFEDFICRQGELWLVAGPSGCGKTTFLHLLAGLLPVSKGEIIVKGRNIVGLPASETDRIRGREIGIVFQTPHFVQSLTVGENLLLAQQLSGKGRSRERILSLLRKLNIEDKQAAKPHALSQGELQRFSIARAVVHRPSIILADEPTSSLDDANCAASLDLLKEQAGELGASLLVVTHDKRLHPYFTHIMRL